jgi:putative flippase GtrA
MLRVSQIMSYGWIGLVTAFAHYGVLVGLVEYGGFRPVPATLAGYLVGAGVSYTLNRHFTFATSRTHLEAGWRFLGIAGLGFVATWGLMTVFVDRLGWPYLPMQIVTTLLVMAISFTGHKFWSFAEKR